MIDSNKVINYDFRLLYALGIIFVVSGHCFNGGFSIFYEIFPQYAFHVPLFIFVSGYFYKNNVDIKQYIWTKTKNLIFPLFLWNFFYAFVIVLMQKLGFFEYININLKSLFIAPLTDSHQFVLNMGGYFVATLYFVHLINIITRHTLIKLNIKIRESFYFIISLLIGFLGCYLSNHNIGPLCLLRILYFLPFYSAGIFYKKYETYYKISNIKYFTFILIIALILIFLYDGMPMYSFDYANFHNHVVIMPFLVGFLGIAFWVKIAKLLSPAIGKDKYVNKIADNTYSILINNFLSFMIVNFIYLLIKKYTLFCQGFDYTIFKIQTFNYFYMPHQLPQMLIIYLIAGIIIPIIIQDFINFIVNHIRNFYRRLKINEF